MGELFANMDKMDIQAERRKTAEAQRRADEIQHRADEVIAEAQRRADEEKENRIRDVVSVGKQYGATKEELADRLRKTHGFDLEEAMKKVEFYWNQLEEA